MDRISLQIKSSTDWQTLAAKLNGWDFEKFPRRITIEVDSGDPVQDCFAVFWIWAAQMAKAFTTEEESYTPEDIHDILCNNFFGWTDEKLIGNTLIKPRLITLTWPERKTKKRMIALLLQIEEWAQDRGVFLKTQRNSEYMQYKESQL